jgi:hypothetical protein
MIWACCLEKLLKVIYGLPRLAYEIMFDIDDELLIRVADVLIIITFITVGGIHDSLGLPLWPPLVAFWCPSMQPC